MVELGTGLPRWEPGKSERASFEVLIEHHLKSGNGRGLVRRVSECGAAEVRLSSIGWRKVTVWTVILALLLDEEFQGEWRIFRWEGQEEA